MTWRDCPQVGRVEAWDSLEFHVCFDLSSADSFLGSFHACIRSDGYNQAHMGLFLFTK